MDFGSNRGAKRSHSKLLRAGLSEFLCARRSAIDPYAAEDIGEFFAVSCEVFFAEPELLREEYPDYFGELRRYFRIDPVAGRILG